MLTTCAECALQVSDKAIYCPHCGFPQQPDVKPAKPRSSKKRRRLPNGFGQISEIKNANLRNPFRAMVSIGKSPSGRPICKPLKPESYFATYNDAYAALVEYNKNPYDLAPSITVAELYEKWSAEHFETLKSDKSASSIRSAWKYCSSVSNIRVIDLRARHIKGCIDGSMTDKYGRLLHPTAVMKNKVKSLFNVMLDYAVEYEIVDKNYARAFALPPEVVKDMTTAKNKHIPFTDEEIDILWANVAIKDYVDIILIQCYSGWRPQELCSLELSKIDLETWMFVGGMKTESGTNRAVPIHSRIQPLIKARYDKAITAGRKYLFSYEEADRRNKETSFTYRRYVMVFDRVIKELKLNEQHRPHDGRKHFVTTAKKYDVDEYAIKYMVGHKISDLTERVYTERELSWLVDEIEKIK